MVIPVSLKLNKFKLVKIPSNRDIFSRFGKFTPGANAYTGDESVNLHLDKVGTLVQADADLVRQVEAIKQRKSEEESALQ